MNILGLDREFIKSFDTFSDAYIEREINLVPVFNFSIPGNLGKYFKEEYYVQLEGYGEYIVKEKKKSSGRYDIVCKPNLDDFKKDFYPNYTYTSNTLKAILTPLLEPIGWTIECADTSMKTLTGKDKTLLEIIIHAMELFEYEYIWDIPSKKIIAGVELGSDKGAYLHQELNLRQLNVTTHSYDYVTRLIPKGKDDLGIEGVNNGVPYLEPAIKYSNKIVYGVWRDERYTIPENLKASGQKMIDSVGAIFRSYEVDVINLARLSDRYTYLEYDLGDRLTLVDNENETYSKERVISKKEYIREPLKDSVVLSNAPLGKNTINANSEAALREAITVTRQYITVLEGEIKSKVSREEYDGLDERLYSAEQLITPEKITETVRGITDDYLVANKDNFKGDPGAPGSTPVILDGYWYLNGQNTGVLAAGKDGKTLYRHVMYADDELGANMSQNSSGKFYRGEYYDYEIADSQFPDAYTWYKFIAEDGKDALEWTIGTDNYWYQNGIKTDKLAKGKDADVWTIGPDGYWYLNGARQTIKAQGEQGEPGNTPYIQGGYWWINGVNTNIKAVGTDGKDGTKWTIGPDGYWYMDGVKTNVKAQGEPGTAGKSAYQLAVEAGYKGTQDQWLTSLKGTDGTYKGTTPPQDTSQLWLDTNVNKLKFFDGVNWAEMTKDMYDAIQDLQGRVASYQAISENLGNLLANTVKEAEKQALRLSENESAIKQYSDKVTTEFSRLETIVGLNGEEVKKITAVITTSVDADGNPYTEWKAGNDDKITVGSGGIVMNSAGQDAFVVKGGIAEATSLYVKEAIGFGNHTAQKYGTEFTIFAWTGGNI